MELLPVLFVVCVILSPLCVVFLSYYLPTIVAFLRKRPDFNQILCLNIALGWFSPVWIYICIRAFAD